MCSRKRNSALNFLFLASLVVTSLMVTLLLAACGETTATTGPAAQPTATVFTVTTPTGAATTQPANSTAAVTTSAVTTGAAPTKPVTTTASTVPATTAAPTRPTTSKPATTTGPPSPTPGLPGPISLGQPFDLKEGQSATLPGSNLTVKFATISEDSRCPDSNPKTGKSVACFWSGQVTANIEVSENSGTAQTVKLTLPGSVNTKTVSKDKVGNYQLEVKQILPHAIIDEAIAPGDYIVTLVVTKA